MEIQLADSKAIPDKGEIDGGQNWANFPNLINATSTSNKDTLSHTIKEAEIEHIQQKNKSNAKRYFKYLTPSGNIQNKHSGVKCTS